MTPTLPALKRSDAEENFTTADSEDFETSKSPGKPNAIAGVETKPTPVEPQPSTKLALIPLRSVASSKNAKQQQKPLEAKQFPIVLGRANLSQWWYQSCDCQQYYCRLHCRPVAQNIGSLSKVMIQIDTKGTAHIVGKNPHLVTIITPERGNNIINKSNNNNNNDAKETVDDEKNDEKRNDSNMEKDENKGDHLQPIVLRPRDILSIGRRDREPWMRFQIVENSTSVNPAQKNVSKNTAIAKTGAGNADAGNAACAGTIPVVGDAGQVATKGKSPQPRGQVKPFNNNYRQAQKQQRSPDAEITANPNSSTQQRNGHHDAQLPEWITTTTTTNTGAGKRNKSSSSYHNFGVTDTKQQQQHQAMVATLTKAAAAAGAAADADERNKSKKYYRCNSYYNYYNHGSYDADSNAQRRRRRYSNSSFAPYHHGLSSHNNKSAIRSAEDLYHNGSSRRGGRLQGHHNDPQIHLVFRDFETSARLIRAGSKRGRSAIITSKETGGGCTHDDDGGDKISSMDDQGPSSHKMRRFARTDRIFIGNPPEGSIITTTTNTSSVACNDGEKSMGLLSQNYAAALLEVSKAPVSTSLEPPADKSTRGGL